MFVCVCFAFTGFAYMTNDKKRYFMQSAQMHCSVLEGGAQDVNEPVRGICIEAGNVHPSRVGSKTGALVSHRAFLRNLQDCQTLNGIAP